MRTLLPTCSGGTAAWKHSGFTLIELLIVIGLLGALATLFLSNLSVTRDEVLDNSIVQKELADIQRAFQRFKADCLPTQADYKLISRYGLSVLMEHHASLGWDFDKWDPARNRGWRGPYIHAEDTRQIDASINDSNSYDLSTKAQLQDASGLATKVLETPYQFENGEDFYRVLPELADDGRIQELYVVAPITDNVDLVLNAGVMKDKYLLSFAGRHALENASARASYQNDLADYLDHNPCRRRLILE